MLEDSVVVWQLMQPELIASASSRVLKNGERGAPGGSVTAGEAATFGSAFFASASFFAGAPAKTRDPSSRHAAIIRLNSMPVRTSLIFRNPQNWNRTFVNSE